MADSNFRTNKLFDGIPAGVLDRLALTAVGYEANDVIFREGDPAECLFLIETGTVRISKVGRGGQQETLAYFEAGDFFGEMGLYERTTRSARATAVGPVLLGCLDLGGFEELLRAAPTTIVQNLLQASVSRLRATDAHLIREMLEAERLSLIGAMLSSIVHDIRGPLSTIRIAADMLSEPLADEKRQRYAGMVGRSVERISDMAQELLDYSRGTTRLNFEVVSPRELIGELREEVLQPLSASGIEVSSAVAYDEPVMMDRGRFFRVIQNIVKNAAEAMPDGGRLSLTVEREEKDVVFRIADTGVGIPAEVLPTIFEPFVTYGKSGGTGLGMAIVRSVVEAHHGRIQVESTVGKGTRFTISIPATFDAPADEGAKQD